MSFSPRRNFADIYRAVLLSAADHGAVVDVQMLSPTGRFDDPVLFPTEAVISLGLDDGDTKLLSLATERGEVRVAEWTDDTTLTIHGVATRGGQFLFGRDECSSAKELAQKVVGKMLGAHAD